MPDPLLTASRDCGRKRWSINTYPQLPQTLQLKGVASWILKGGPNFLQILTITESFLCAKALSKALSTWVTLLLEPAKNGSMTPILQMRTLRQENLSNLPQFIQTPNGKLQSGLQQSGDMSGRILSKSSGLGLEEQSLNQSCITYRCVLLGKIT